jgi:hypothetical protein
VANQSAVQQNGEAVVRDEPVPHSLAPSGAFFNLFFTTEFLRVFSLCSSVVGFFQFAIGV